MVLFRVCLFSLPLILMITGCAKSPSFQIADVYMANQAIAEKIAVLPEKNSGRVWIPLQAMANAIGMKVYGKESRIVIGSTDPAYTLQVNQMNAFIGDKPITLTDAPKQLENQIYITDRALTDLWTLPIKWDPVRHQISVTPADHQALALWLATYNINNSPTKIFNYVGGIFPFMSAKAAVNSQELVRYALQFQGTPFLFDSDSNGSSPKTFDSSSFIRHVYGHFGISLPRTAISQAEMGINVMDEPLHEGDLLFFDTLGQKNGNRLVGHVGMYIGNNRFIHTYGDAGVTISDFNGDWSGRFLFTKRIH
jgi:cell wall-associated NlpC family hydrolase